MAFSLVLCLLYLRMRVRPLKPFSQSRAGGSRARIRARALELAAQATVLSRVEIPQALAAIDGAHLISDDGSIQFN